jgi:hypothetical protein
MAKTKLDMTKSYHLNYLRFKLIKVENDKNKANPHEQGTLTSFLGLDSLELNFGKFSINFGIMDN